MRKTKRAHSTREIRHFRIRKKLRGSPERLRLCLSRSGKHLEAQLVDDYAQKTLLGLTTRSKEFLKKSGLSSAAHVQAAEKFGAFVADRAKAGGIQKVVFDRGGYLYHGRVKAFADAARAAGLLF